MHYLTRHLHPLKRRIIRLHMMVFGMDGVFGLGVQYRKICIAAHLDHTLFRVGAHELGRLGRGNLHKAVGRDAPFADSFAEQHNATRFNAGQAVGDLGKIVFMAIFLLAGKIGMVAVDQVDQAMGLPSPKALPGFPNRASAARRYNGTRLGAGTRFHPA